MLGSFAEKAGAHCRRAWKRALEQLSRGSAHAFHSTESYPPLRTAFGLLRDFLLPIVQNLWSGVNESSAGGLRVSLALRRRFGWRLNSTRLRERLNSAAHGLLVGRARRVPAQVDSKFRPY